MSPEALAALPASHRLIVAAGALRSGSTAVYNIARLILEQQDGSFTAGWFKDIKGPVGDSVLVKIHRWEPALAERADVVLTSHRDLREIVRSMAAIGWLKPEPDVYPQLERIVGFQTQWQSVATLDVAYEAMKRDMLAAVSAIAAAIGGDSSQVDFGVIVREVDAMPSPSALPEGQPHDLKTLMHLNHRSRETTAPLLIEDAIHRHFLAWQTMHGYF